MSESVPSFHTLQEIYQDSQIHEARYNDLVKKFEGIYHHKPHFFVRAPGRVNLIGEHVDYSGYPVLPMAIERDTIVAVSTSEPDGADTTLNMHNVDPRYTPKTITHASNTPPQMNNKQKGSENHHWTDYYLCGYKGVIEYALSKQLRVHFVNMNILVHGTVPTGSGLSSSSALSCASALATMVANKLDISKGDLSEVACKSERYAGVESGGMDQAISFLAEKGFAKFVEFEPIRARSVRLPAGATFVVSNTLVEANKYATASSNYNMRVVECRLASAILGKNLGVQDFDTILTLSKVQTATGRDLKQMEEAVSQFLPKTVYSLQDVATELGFSSADEVKQKYFISGAGSQLNISEDRFELQQRARHVFSESRRVLDFARISNMEPYNAQLEDLGKLMNESHYSCRDDFKVSCNELEMLTTIARNNGAFGSRLTGAGWGGCVVSLVPTELVSEFLDKVWEEYYVKVCNKQGPINQDFLFASRPGQGAAIYIPQQ